MATNLAARLGRNAVVRIFESGETFVPAIPAAAQDWLLNYMRERVDCHMGNRVDQFDKNGVTLSDGTHYEHDLALLAVGLSPPSWLSAIGLENDHLGLLINHHLQSSDPRIFAVGDCASFRGQPLPKVGVYGVRAAPTLLHNLRASVLGEPLMDYHPQRHYLGVMNLGWGRGLAWRGRHWWQGRTALWLKDWIDRRFIARYR